LSDTGIWVGGYDLHPLNDTAFFDLHVVPGSFNPLHDGHRHIYDSIQIDRWGSAKFFEISASRVDKEDLTKDEIFQRLDQFRGYAPVIVTKESLFIDKIKLLRRCCVSQLHFHMGIDTYQRAVDNYGIDGIEALDAKFHVWPRIHKGVLQDLQSVPVRPVNVVAVPQTRAELLAVSSTAIRSANVSQGK
jgi:hypothetical protein